MKKLKIVLIVIGVMLVLFGIAAVSYRITKTQGVVESYTINDVNDGKQILIATQQKGFKDDVIENVRSYFQDQPVFIKVIDVTTLESIQVENWNAIVILTTIQSSDIQPDVRTFLERQNDFENVLLLTTADSKRWTHKDIEIDCVTSASIKDNIQPYSDSIITFITRWSN